MKKLEIAGEKYGKLTALRIAQKTGKATRWLFVCDCGKEKSISLDAVRTGRVRSCGCLRVEVTKARSTTHGHSLGGKESRELKSYNHAKSRCQNPNDSKYPVYGGRGIKMLEPWLSDAATFIADMGPCPPKHSIDRIDPNGHYEKNNCRWATTHEQARTRTDNVIVDYQGVKMVLKDYASLMGINYKTLHSRMKYRGMSLAEASII